MEKPKEGFVFQGSKAYWEERYANGGNSGSGSLNRLGAFKAEIVNGFIREHSIHSVMEWGCGDGNQLSLMQFPDYWGLDVSETVIKKCQELFKGDKTKRFSVIGPALDTKRRADISLSLDVLYHLVEDEVYETYMQNLFLSAKRYVCIYAKDEDSPQGGYYNHMRHRKFSEYIGRNFTDWKLYRHIPNRYPYDINDYNNTSPSDFYFYKRKRFGLF